MIPVAKAMTRGTRGATVSLKGRAVGPGPEEIEFDATVATRCLGILQIGSETVGRVETDVHVGPGGVSPVSPGSIIRPGSGGSNDLVFWKYPVAELTHGR